ncbi:MAG TPA: hypothetical protein VII96_01245 [Acidimicrobiales bacterium]
MIRKMLVIATAVAMPLGAISAIAATGTAGAAGPPDTGSITCVGTQTASLSPAFHFGGTVVTKQQTTLTAGAPTCSGNVPTAATTGAVKIKVKYAKPGTNVADCSNLGSTTIAPFTVKVKWSDKTKSVFNMAGGGPSGAGFLTTGTVAAGGSFGGETVSIQSNLSSADIAAIVACSTGGPDVGTLNLTSTISIS